ncbi:flippase [Candidatus Azambacteria bacterium]|nr:flippase [Candidatus Azambacteria bacterium]
MSELKKKIAQNFLISFGGRFAAGALGVVSVALITRTIGTDGFGAYSTVLAFLYIFSVCADFGLYPFLAREIAKPDADEAKVVSVIFSTRLFLLGASMALSFAVVSFMPYSAAVKWGVVVAALGFAFQSLSAVLMGVFQKHLKTAIPALADIAARVTQLAAAAYLFYAGGSFLHFLFVFTLGGAVQFFVVWSYVRRQIPFALMFRKEALARTLKESWPMAVSAVLVLVYFKGDTLLLSLLQAPHEVGVYGVAYKILENIIFFPIMFVGLVMPLLSKYFTADKTMFRAVFQKTFDFLAILVVPLTAGGIYLAPDIVRILAGSGFEEAALPLRILLVAIVFIFFGALFGSTIIAIHEQKRVMWVYGGAALLNIIANLYLISRYSYVGAAATTAATELVVSSLMLFIIYRATAYLPRIGALAKAGGAAAVMAAALVVSPSQSFLFLTALGVLVYAGALYALKGVTQEDLRVLRQIMRPSRELI